MKEKLKRYSNNQRHPSLKKTRKSLPKFDELFVADTSKPNSSSYLFEKQGMDPMLSNVTSIETSNDTFDKLAKGTCLPLKSTFGTSNTEKPFSSNSHVIDSSSNKSEFLFVSPKLTQAKQKKCCTSPDLFDVTENNPKIVTRKNKKRGRKKLSRKIGLKNKTKRTSKFKSPEHTIPPIQLDLHDSTPGNSNIVSSTPAIQRKNTIESIKEVSNELSPIFWDENRTVFEHSSVIDFEKEAEAPKLSFNQQDGSSHYYDALNSSPPSVQICKVISDNDNPCVESFHYGNLKDLNLTEPPQSISHKVSNKRNNKVTKRKKKKNIENQFKIPLYGSLCSVGLSKNNPKDSLLQGVKNNSDISMCHQPSKIFKSSFFNSLNNLNKTDNSYLSIKPGKSWRRSHFHSLRSNNSSFGDTSTQSEQKTRIEVSIIDTPSDKFVLLSSKQAKEKVLQLCSQKEPQNISSYFNEEILSRCEKIGEGLYGEVFLISSRGKDSSVVTKIMPIEGDFAVNNEPQKTFREISSEIAISIEVSLLNNRDNYSCPAFVFLNQAKCLQGEYPKDLLLKWDKFNEDKGSENDRPDQFPLKQLYIMLEFENAGQNLESFVFNNAMQSHAIFLQISYGLACAEERLEFEHRDLHWGIVLISQDSSAKIEFVFGSKSCKLPTRGLKAKIIDFTLSRLKISKHTYFYNLEDDPSMFTSEGDIQFEVYRQMRIANGGDWKKFTPKTNILWLKYILEKMSTDCYYKNVKTKIHCQGIRLLKSLSKEILDYNSAIEFVSKKEENLL